MVFTRSYAAVASLIFSARKDMFPLGERSTSTPICDNSFAIVAMSMSRGMLPSESGFAVSSAAHMIGSAAFLAPETAISPSSGRPPLILSLSTGFPFLGREGAHGERVNFLAHALPQRRVDELMALHPVAAGELTCTYQRLE